MSDAIYPMVYHVKKSDTYGLIRTKVAGLSAIKIASPEDLASATTERQSKKAPEEFRRNIT